MEQVAVQLLYDKDMFFFSYLLVVHTILSSI